MSWDAIGALPELFAAIGVIFTLAFLAMQSARTPAQCDEQPADGKHQVKAMAAPVTKVGRTIDQPDVRSVGPRASI